MNEKHKKYQILFFSTLKLSACTFGGGFVIVSLMRKKFVEELHWIEEQEMLDLVAIAQSSPGAIAVNAAIIVGYHVAGGMGVLLAMLGTILPPFTIISIISLFYQAFRDQVLVSMALTGMLAGVAAVICDVVVSMIQAAASQKRILPFAVMIGAFVCTHFLHMNILVIIGVCGILGAADTLHRGRKGVIHK